MLQAVTRGCKAAIDRAALDAVGKRASSCKDKADIVCSAPYGDGVSEFVRSVQEGKDRIYIDYIE